MNHSFARLKNRLQEKSEQPQARPVLYVAIGDSVTQGCMELGKHEHEQVYHHLLKRRLEQHYPLSVINVINAGVSGDSAHASRERWQRDVLSMQPDLVTIKFGLNDSHRGEPGLATYREAITELIHSIRSQTEAEILLMTSSMMLERDNELIHPNHRALVDTFIRIHQNGNLRKYVDVVRNISTELDVPLLDIYAMWEQMQHNGIDIHLRLANGINHPDREFHHQMAAAMENVLIGGLKP